MKFAYHRSVKWTMPVAMGLLGVYATSLAWQGLTAYLADGESDITMPAMFAPLLMIGAFYQAFASWRKSNQILTAVDVTPDALTLDTEGEAEVYPWHTIEKIEVRQSRCAAEDHRDTEWTLEVFLKRRKPALRYDLTLVEFDPVVLQAVLKDHADGNIAITLNWAEGPSKQAEIHEKH